MSFQTGQPPKAGRRSRIVVNLDDPNTSAQQPSGGGGGASYTTGQRKGGSRLLKILGALALVLAVVIAAAGIGGYVWWGSFRKTPAYSLALIADAALRNDQAVLDQMIDTDAVAQNFVPQVADKALANTPGGLGNLAAPMLRERLDKAMPQILPTIRQTVRDEISKNARELAARGANVPFPLLALGVRAAAGDIRQQDDKSFVKLTIAGRQVELGMQQNGERWRIVQVKDDELANRLAQQVQQNLPALAQDELDRQLRNRTGKGLPRNTPNANNNSNLPQLPNGIPKF